MRTRPTLPTAVFLLLCPALIPVPARAFQNLEIRMGERRWEMDARQKEGRAYFELARLAELMGLELRERGGLLTVSGPRARLTLVDGRRLLRLQDHYLLLSGASWRRGKNDWYVTEDFLTKAIPLVTDRRLERLSPGRYRVEMVEQNRVRVRVANHADHVRVVFEPSREAPITVRERDRYIEVQFSRYVVEPEFPSSPPDGSLVASVGFDSTDVYGVFRIYKGEGYHNFREFSLTQPDRRVIDVYGRPPAALAGAPPEAPPPDASTPADPGPPGEDPGPVVESPRIASMVTIDPGHGGQDYGVRVSPDLLEKELTLNLAGQIEAYLSARGYSSTLTRTRDVELGLEQRSALGNFNDSRVYLSLHAGGSPSPEVHGPLVYVYRDGRPEVWVGARRLTATVSEPEEGSTAGGEPDGMVAWVQGQRPYRQESRLLAEALQRDLNLLWGTQHAVLELPLQVLAPVMAPAVVVELGFLTNEEDREKLRSSSFQTSLAATIAAGVARFLERRASHSAGVPGR